MTRYTEYLKEKVMCVVCKRDISRGHIPNHIKSKIHQKNLKEIEDIKQKYLSKCVTITWD
tara:strand:+ start:3719 stop:3898 length:180 start_codon:yes stop_codon:yes gene_type:complete